MNTPACAPTATSDRWIALAFLTFSALTSVIDNSVMTVVTPTIEQSFHASFEAVEWTTSSYALVFGATMLLWGKLGAMFGHLPDVTWTWHHGLHNTSGRPDQGDAAS